MKIIKSDLLGALEIVKPGLANREIIEQVTSFAFINGMVVTYNDRISIAHPVPGLELEGAVVADNLYKFLSKIKDEEIELEVEGNEIIITSGRSKAGLTLQSEIKLPLKRELETKAKWKDLPENFVEGMKFVMSACSKDMSMPIYTAVHVNKEGYVEGTDRYRIAHFELSSEMPVETFLLPATSAVEVVKLQPTKIAEGGGWMHFQTEEGTIISCRIYAEEFPSSKAFLKMEGAKLILPKTVEEVLDRAMIFAKRDHLLDESVDITVSNNRLKVSAKAEAGWFKEETNMRYEGDPIMFSIAPYLLKGILSKTQGCEITSNKLKFEGEGWKYITTLRNG